MEDMLWIETLLRAHQLPHFLPILELARQIFWIFTRSLLRVHSQPSKCMKWRWKQKIEKHQGKKKKLKINLILLHVNHTFLYWTLEFDLKPLNTLIVP